MHIVKLQATLSQRALASVGPCNLRGEESWAGQCSIFSPPPQAPPASAPTAQSLISQHCHFVSVWCGRITTQMRKSCWSSIRTPRILQAAPSNMAYAPFSSKEVNFDTRYQRLDFEDGTKAQGAFNIGKAIGMEATRYHTYCFTIPFMMACGQLDSSQQISHRGSPVP